MFPEENKILNFLKTRSWQFLSIALIFSLLVNSFFPQNALAATLNPGSNFTVCAGAAYYGIGATPSVTVYWTFVSPAGNTQKTYQVQISADSGFASIAHDSGTVTDSAARTYTALTGMVYGTFYYWRLKVSDNNDSVIDWVQGESFYPNLPSLNLKGGLRLQGGVRLK